MDGLKPKFNSQSLIRYRKVLFMSHDADYRNFSRYIDYKLPKMAERSDDFPLPTFPTIPISSPSNFEF